MKFTDKYLKSLKSTGIRFEVKEDSGLIIRVSKAGSKSFCYVYKINGKLKRLTLGSYPDMSLAEARTEFAKMQGLRKQGKDPAQEKQESKQKIKTTPTISEFKEEFINRWCKPNKKSWQKDKINLEKYVIPLLGDKKIADVSRRDIIRIIDPIRERNAEVQANRVYACVRRMFNFAVERGVIETSPATHIKLTQEKSRERILANDEIPAVFKVLNSKQLWIGTRFAIELILRTAQRPGEIRLMRREEIDHEKKIWTIPAVKTKNKISQTVPLTQKMLSIIDVAASVSNSNWIFCSPTKEGEPLSDFALAQAMRKALSSTNIERVTPHDLRRTAATTISELGFNRLIIDKILNHKDTSMSGIYDRHSYDQEKRQALEAWERELEQILSRSSKKDNVSALNS